MGLAQRFFRGSVLNLADQALRFAAVFVMTPIIIRCLGDDRYGFWVLLMSIVGHYSLLDFGLSFSISRFFSRAIGGGDERELSVLVSTTMAIMLKIGVIALIITGVGFLLIPVFGLSDELAGLARWIVLLYGLFLALGFPVRVYRSLLKSHLRYDLLVGASTVQIILGNVLIFYFLTKGHGILALAIINVAAGILEYVIVVLAVQGRASRRVPLKRSLVSPERRREILRYSGVSFVNQLGLNLRSRIDPIIIGTVVSYSAVTFYAIGTRFPVYLTDVVGAVLGGQLLAVFSQSQGKTGSAEESTGQFLTATRMSAVIALFCGSSMIFYGREFVQRWMGEGYDVSYHILAILMVAHVFSLMQYPSLSYLYSLAKHRYLAITTIVGGVGNLVLSLVLVQYYGIYGVVWATFIEMLVVYLVAFPVIICRVGGVGVGSYLGGALASPVARSLLVLAPFFMVTSRFLEADYTRLGVLGLIQVAYFMPLAWFLVLNREERQLLRSALPRRSP